MMENNTYEINQQSDDLEDIYNNKDLKELIIKDCLTYVYRPVLINSLDISYVARRKSDNALIILIGNDKLDEIKNSNEYYNIIDMKKFNEHIINYYYNLQDFVIMTKNVNLSNLLTKIYKENINLPLKFVKKLLNAPISIDNENKLINYDNYYDFRFFANEIQPIIIPLINNLPFYDLAYLMGCFSPEEVQNFGTESKIYLAQKATSLLSKFIKTNQFDIPIYTTVGWNDLKIKPNKDFLEFISIIDNGNYSNFNMLLELNNSNIDDSNDTSLFEETVGNFATIKSMRKSINDKGMPYNKPWKKCIIECFVPFKYLNVTDENRNMAFMFFEKGISQETFDRVNALLNQSKENNMPHNILNIPLKEENLLSQIRKLKEENKQALSDGRKILSQKFNDLIADTYAKQFTYELLDKYDPINAIIGAYCSCCATMDSDYYGESIAKATITQKDVQNIVVRDENNEIVAKGAMYVNSEKGYALINDFELNEKYKKHEFSIGLYNIDKLSNEEQERENIFGAFMRAVTDFVKEYDIEHPENPLKQVNVGMGYNRLKAQCNRLDLSHKLHAPENYEFKDTEMEQRILYKRPDNQDKCKE